MPMAGDEGRDDLPAAPGPGNGPGTGSSPDVHRWWTLTAVCVGTFMLLLDITIVNVALPDVQKELHSSFSGLQWVVDAYALTLASTLLTCGSLADLFGRRRAYLAGLMLFTAASLLCGLANGTLFLELARGAQGVGGAAMFAVSLALLAQTFRGKDRGIAFGVWGAVTGLAVAVGPVVGGALTSGLSWRWIFFVNVPVGAAALAITWTRVRESRDPRPRRPDWWGFVCFTASLAFLVFALIKSGERGFSDPLVLGCFAASAVLLAVFLVVEAVGREPMFDLSLLSKPTFSGGLIAAFGMSASMFPARQRPAAALAARSAFTAGLNHILLVAAVIALVSGVLSLLLIRSQDFVPATQE